MLHTDLPSIIINWQSTKVLWWLPRNTKTPTVCKWCHTSKLSICTEEDIVAAGDTLILDKSNNTKHIVMAIKQIMAFLFNKHDLNMTYISLFSSWFLFLVCTRTCGRLLVVRVERARFSMGGFVTEKQFVPFNRQITLYFFGRTYFLLFRPLGDAPMMTEIKQDKKSPDNMSVPNLSDDWTNDQHWP